MTEISEKFAANDLVAVFGGEIGKDGKRASDVTLCNVLAVGSKDLIVEESIKTSFTTSKKLYTVSQSICHKLELDPNILSTGKILIPQLGDLVLSYSRDRYKDETAKNITGILYKISYKLGRPNTATLMCGNDMCDIPFSSLMVLHTRDKN
jgi:hypothetical protein